MRYRSGSPSDLSGLRPNTNSVPDKRHFPKEYAPSPTFDNVPVGYQNEIVSSGGGRSSRRTSFPTGESNPVSNGLQNLSIHGRSKSELRSDRLAGSLAIRSNSREYCVCKIVAGSPNLVPGSLKEADRSWTVHWSDENLVSESKKDDSRRRQIRFHEETARQQHSDHSSARYPMIDHKFLCQDIQIQRASLTVLSPTRAVHAEFWEDARNNTAAEAAEEDFSSIIGERNARPVQGYSSSSDGTVKDFNNFSGSRQPSPLPPTYAFRCRKARYVEYSQQPASYQIEIHRQLSTRNAYAHRKTLVGPGYRQEGILYQTQYQEDRYATGHGPQDRQPSEDTNLHRNYSHSIRTESEYEGRHSRPGPTTSSPHDIGKLAEHYTREAGNVSTGSNAYKCIRRKLLFTSALS